MRHAGVLKAEAVRLRALEGFSLNELAERLGIPKSTVRYWVKDTPPGSLSELRQVQRLLRQSARQQAGTAAMQAKYAAMRQEAYAATNMRATELLQDLVVRDFVILYLAEGYRKQRNCVALSNSNPRIIKFAHNAMRRLATNPHFYYSFQYHADQNPDELKLYWAAQLGISSEQIHPIPKTNSGHLEGRRFACEHGVFQIQVGDTRFRAELQALMDAIQEEWAAH
jgi:transcriptional regulator with XRE-family HTH domain